MKKFLKLLHQWWKLAISDPRRMVRFPSEIWNFFSDLRKFRAQSGSTGDLIEIHPVLFQKNIRSTFDAHYVYQSAWAIRRILLAAPKEHVDISSNIPFVASLSAVIPVRFCEYRPPLITLPGLTTEHVDITKLPFPDNSVKSLSCLHVLEHIGLGRYGDPINPQGLEQACREIARVTAPGGAVFLSIPVGRKRVCFNMHRVSDATALPKIFGDNFFLKDFSVVKDDRTYLENVSTADFGDQEYACGLYWFEKRKDD